MYDYTIIGYGVTGMLVLAILQANNVDLSKVCVIDTYFDGGALLRDYGSVISNTPLSKCIDGLKLISPEYTIPEEYKHHDLSKTTPLRIISNIIKDFTKDLLHKIDTIQDTVLRIEKNIHFKISTRKSEIESNKLILCQGANQKALDCELSSIPIHIALNKELLKNYIKPNDSVLVFGTAHSGCLVLENLYELNIKTSAVYKGSKPFLFARDGEYDGIKEEAARIADSIINNEYTNLNLIHISQIDKILKSIKKCNWVIYCIGFETSTIPCNFDLTKYDKSSGKILEIDKAFGFGIAYPSLAPDSIHVDVGIISFIEHIQKQIQLLLH